MNRTLSGLVLAMSLCGGSMAEAQTATSPRTVSDSAQVVEAIATLEQSWARALVEQDTTTLNRLLAPEFGLTVSAAPQRPLPRSAWFASLPAYRTRALQICGLQVRVVDDIAIASFVARLDASYQGADRSGEFFITDVWVQRSGLWQVVARYSSKPESNTGSARALTGEGNSAC